MSDERTPARIPPEDRAPPASFPRNPRPIPLALKLGSALALATGFMIVFLLLVFGPQASSTFKNHSDELIDLSRDALSRMVRKNTTDTNDVLTRMIERFTDSRRRHMKDLPLSLYEGDEERIRGAINEFETRRNAVFQGNVGVLAREMERRALEDVDRRLKVLADRQRRVGDAFAGQVRAEYLALTGAVFALLLLLLGVGLYRAVVHPVRRLSKVSRAVAAGDLDVDVPTRSRDEVGALSRDFASMVTQLRASRETVRRKSDELEALNRSLEDEVARKTSHLMRALEDLKRTQKQLIHAEKMASIGTLAGGVAHEFNNLIGGIRGCAREALEDETDPDRRETLDVIVRASARAGEITDQLLKFSKQRALVMKPVDTVRILEEALVLAEPEARRVGIRVVKRLDAVPTVAGDGDALHQVFLNLYRNALQAMTEGDTLTVETEAAGREVRIRVSDSGVGIPAEQVDRIFEPFFTTKDTHPDPAVRGSGLGLSVSYSIVEAHGGRITVESEPGRGSRFTVILPVAEGPIGETHEDEA